MDNGHIEIANEIMLNIACSNGWVNRWEPVKFNKRWVDKIALKAGIFFDKYPDLLNDDNLMEICDGEVSEVEEKFGLLDGFKELNEIIGKYFERGKM
jgi:hypothetical protein